MKNSNSMCIYFATTLLNDPHYEEGYLKPSCTADPDNLIDFDDVKHFTYCPYCGKPIYVMEERD